MTDGGLTLREAAQRLGVSEGAVRKRVARGTLRSELGADGRRYVYPDGGADGGTDTSAPHESSALTSELRAHIADLREQLQAERTAHSEARRLLAAALERIPPQLEASPGSRESPTTPDSPGPTRTPTDPDEAPQQPTSRERSWWQRMFGG